MCTLFTFTFCEVTDQCNAPNAYQGVLNTKHFSRCHLRSAETWTLTKQAQNKLAAAQTKMERSMLNVTYEDRKPTSGSGTGQKS